MKRKQKKNVRQRGAKTHGWGAKKKHRGSGNRGGKGNAGTGKRADCKKPSINPMLYFGRHGFSSIYSEKYHVINIGSLNSNYDSFRQLEKDGVLDLDGLGYKKLLSTGNLTQKLSIKVKEASKKAVEKVEKAGGRVILPAKPQAQAEKPESKEKPK
jgi:large subunit ribosomal protein L15